jgi:hypothetical protein
MINMINITNTIKIQELKVNFIKMKMIWDKVNQYLGASLWALTN